MILTFTCSWTNIDNNPTKRGRIHHRLFHICALCSSCPLVALHIPTQEPSGTGHDNAPMLNSRGVGFPLNEYPIKRPSYFLVLMAYKIDVRRESLYYVLQCI